MDAGDMLNLFLWLTEKTNAILVLVKVIYWRIRLVSLLFTTVYSTKAYYEQLFPVAQKNIQTW